MPRLSKYSRCKVIGLVDSSKDGVEQGFGNLAAGRSGTKAVKNSKLGGSQAGGCEMHGSTSNSIVCLQSKLYVERLSR